MKVTICKAFTFDSAHYLTRVPEGHKCRRMHGHTYRVELICEGEPDDRGMVVDYGELAVLWDPVHALLDHRLLNEIPGLENPTTEVLAPFILALLQRAAPILPLVALRVYESSTTWCEVRAPAGVHPYKPTASSL